MDIIKNPRDKPLRSNDNRGNFRTFHTDNQKNAPKSPMDKQHRALSSLKRLLYFNSRIYAGNDPPRKPKKIISIYISFN